MDVMDPLWAKISRAPANSRLEEPFVLENAIREEHV